MKQIVSLRASAVLEMSMVRIEFHDVCISQLCLSLIVTPTVSKKVQTNVMFSYKLFIKFHVFLNSAYLCSKIIIFCHCSFMKHNDLQPYQWIYSTFIPLIKTVS